MVALSTIHTSQVEDLQAQSAHEISMVVYRILTMDMQAKPLFAYIKLFGCFYSVCWNP
jgi:hypothetical protein